MGYALRSKLMHASQSLNEDIVKILVDAGANVNLQDYYGRTALMFVASEIQVKLLGN